VLAIVAGVATPAPARAADAGGDIEAKPHLEFYSGAEAFRHAWSLYSGATFAPFGSILEDGLRLRAAGRRLRRLQLFGAARRRPQR
jgi:hypothetical protein